MSDYVCLNCHRRYNSGDGLDNSFCSSNCSIQYYQNQQASAMRQEEEQRRYQRMDAYERERVELQRQQSEAEQQRLIEQREFNQRMETQARNQKDIEGLVIYFEYFKTHPITTDIFPEVRKAHNRADEFINGNYDYTIKSIALSLQGLLKEIDTKYKEAEKAYAPIEKEKLRLEAIEQEKAAEAQKKRDEILKKEYERQEKEYEKQRQEYEKQRQEYEIQQQEAEREEKERAREQEKNNLKDSQLMYFGRLPVSPLYFLISTVLFFLVECLFLFALDKLGSGLKIWGIAILLSFGYGYLLTLFLKKPSRKRISYAGLSSFFLLGVFPLLSGVYKVYKGIWEYKILPLSNEVLLYSVMILVAVCISLFYFSKITIFSMTIISALIGYGCMLCSFNIATRLYLIYMVFTALSILSPVLLIFKKTGDGKKIFLGPLGIFAVFFALDFLKVSLLISFIISIIAFSVEGLFCGLLVRSKQNLYDSLDK